MPDLKVLRHWDGEKVEARKMKKGLGHGDGLGAKIKLDRYNTHKENRNEYGW